MILRTETFGSLTKEKSTHSRKGALTTARPLLANARLTGETSAKNFADTCYTASGSRAESQPQPIKRIIKQSERVGHRMRYTYFPKQELKFTHPEKNQEYKNRCKNTKHPNQNRTPIRTRTHQPQAVWSSR